jgi:outer membrane protein
MVSLDKSKMNTDEYYRQYDNMKQAYFTKEKQYADDNAAQAQQYTDEVWKQLNQYIKEFGIENGYDYIIGANGEGSLMYAKEQHDISKELTLYVNEKYAGK